jgi:transcriptional regulator with XRE-family HTH domain
MQLSDYLKQTRIEKEQTQLEAATEVGVHVQTWSNWERGQTTRDIETLSRIADWVGGDVTAHDLNRMSGGIA